MNQICVGEPQMAGAGESGRLMGWTNALYCSGFGLYWQGFIQETMICDVMHNAYV